MAVFRWGLVSRRSLDGGTRRVESFGSLVYVLPWLVTQKLSLCRPKRNRASDRLASVPAPLALKDAPRVALDFAGSAAGARDMVLLILLTRAAE
jgi:hypothetical protein